MQIFFSDHAPYDQIEGLRTKEQKLPNVNNEIMVK